MPRKTSKRRPPVRNDKRVKKYQGADMGPMERWQHTGRILEYTDIAGVMAARASEEHVLDKLVLFKLLDEIMRDAGLRLKEDYMMARMEEHISASYAGPRTSGTRDPENRFLRNDVEEAAYTRWRSAVKSVAQPFRNSVIHVCCMGGLPRVQELAKLKAGLRELAQFYRLFR